MFWGSVALISMAGLLALSLGGYPFWGDYRYRQGRFDASIELDAARKIEKNREPRHARPKMSPGERGGPPPRETRTALVQQRVPWVAWPPAQAKHAATTAADLAPVFWAQPGTSIPGHPQAGRDSGKGTIVGGKPVIDTDTGEFRAIAEAHTTKWIEDMQRSEAAFRGGLIV